MSGFVLDASVAASWLLDDEASDYASTALDRLAETGAVVPQLWHSEIRNCLLVAERRKRIDEADSQARLSALVELPIQTDMDPDFEAALALARKHTLSMYDAVYLELASRLRVPLASLDKQLISAATSATGENLPLL